MIVAVSMVKNESEIITYTASHLLANGIDSIIIADNNSTDGTGDLVRRFAKHGGYDITVIDEPMTAFDQSSVITKLYLMAIDKGARWVIPFDADELFIGHGSRISDILLSLDTSRALKVKLYDYRPTNLDRFPGDHNPFRRWSFRNKEAEGLRKVIVPNMGKDVVIWQGNHGVGMGSNEMEYNETDLISIGHFRFHSGFRTYVNRVSDRIRGYNEAGLPDYQGVHYRKWMKILDDRGPDGLEDYLESTYMVVFDDSGKINLNTGQAAEVIYDPVRYCGFKV